MQRRVHNFKICVCCVLCVVLAPALRPNAGRCSLLLGHVMAQVSCVQQQALAASIGHSRLYRWLYCRAVPQLVIMSGGGSFHVVV
jgi:hypothetical protein